MYDQNIVGQLPNIGLKKVCLGNDPQNSSNKNKT